MIFFSFYVVHIGKSPLIQIHLKARTCFKFKVSMGNDILMNLGIFLVYWLSGGLTPYLDFRYFFYMIYELYNE